MNASDGSMMGASRVNLSHETVSRLGIKVMPAGAIVFPKVGGAIHTNKKRVLKSPAAIDTNTMAFIPSDSVRSAYAYYWFIARKLADYSYGAPVPQLSRAQLSSEAFVLPPLWDQDRIVAAIEEEFSRIETGLAAVAAAAGRVRTLGQSMIDAQIAAPSFPRVALAEAVADIEAGKSFMCEARPARADEWGVIKVSAMTWGAFDERENKALPEEVQPDPKHEICVGDLLLSRANTVELVGAAVLVESTRPRLLMSDKSLRLVPAIGVLPEWLLWALRTRESRRQIEAGATGVKDSMRNISQAKIRALRIPLPAVDIQQVMLARMRAGHSGQQKLRGELERSKRMAEALRRSVLAAAFEGRLQLGEAAPQGLALEPG